MRRATEETNENDHHGRFHKASSATTVGTAVDTVSPLRDPSRNRRPVKVAAWIAGVVLLIVVLNLLGVDVRGWLTHLWDQLKGVPISYLIARVALQVAQTTFNGVAYYGILRYCVPAAGVALWPIVTAYAVGVAMNSFLPANIGTFVTLLMFVALIPGSSFAGIFAAYVVNKIFFSVIGALVYLLLFLQAGAAFNVELGWFRDHAVLALFIIVGGAFLIFVLGRMFWHKLEGPLEEGGTGREDPHRSEVLRHARAHMAGS